MLLYFIKRLLMLIPVLFFVSVLVFLIMRVFSPDPATIVLGQHASLEKAEAWREQMGLNEPIITQYLNYMNGVLHGDFGVSYFTNAPVTGELLARLPATIELAVIAIIIASIAGVFFGIISAVKKNSIIDNFTMTTALIGVSMPVFWLGMLLIICFSGWLHWVPSGGRIDTLMRPMGGTGFYFYDTLVIGDYEAFFNALLPIITVIGLQFGSLLSGAVLTETVFAWPGIGAYSVQCILRSDFPVIQGVVLIVAFVFVIMNLLVDLLYAALDPRVKYSQESV